MTVHLSTELEMKPDDTCLCQKNFLKNFCMELQLNSLMKNNKTRWIVVNHLQLHFHPLNVDVIKKLLDEILTWIITETLMYLFH